MRPRGHDSKSWRAAASEWGKSKYASAWAFEKMLKGKRGWWVAPTSDVAKIGWDMLRALADQIPGVVVNETYRTIELPNGGWVQVKGAHLPGKLRGRTLDFLVGDEWAFVNNGAARWNAELRPTLAVKQGEALFISTFEGENHFYELYEMGQDAAHPDWESWRKPSTENPYFPPSELEYARATTPQAEFEQEYLANPLVYVGAVFPGEKVQEATERPVAWDPEADTFAGLDWGYTNATAFEVNREHPTTGAVHWFYERLWVATQLETRVTSIAEACRDHNVVAVYADAAGASENAALAAALRRAGLRTVVQPVPFGKFKESGIKVRRWYLEQGLESMGDVPELIRTTKRYRYKEGTEDVVKVDDHPVDAATAFYASRRGTVAGPRAS